MSMDMQLQHATGSIAQEVEEDSVTLTLGEKKKKRIFSSNGVVAVISVVRCWWW